MNSYPPFFDPVLVVFFAHMNMPSYDTAEDNEVTFQEDGCTTEIEEVGEGWWQGKNLRGEVGMFPGAFHYMVCM